MDFLSKINQNISNCELTSTSPRLVSGRQLAMTTIFLIDKYLYQSGKVGQVLDYFITFLFDKEVKKPQKHLTFHKRRNILWK